jgi:predicted ATPase
MALELSVENFGPFRAARWPIPEGVSVLVGPNGAGKSTLLSALRFWSTAFVSGLPPAVQELGGIERLRHWDAPAADMVRLHARDNAATAVWSVTLAMEGANLHGSIGETVLAGPREYILREPLTEHGLLDGRKYSFRANQLALDLRTFAALPETERSQFVTSMGWALAPALGSRVYRTASFQVERLRSSGSSHSAETMLQPDGGNVFTVLRNWRDKRATANRWDFVREGMRAVFPGQFEDLEFETAGHTIAARVILPGRTASVPHHLMSDGWFNGLLLLTALASADRRSLIAIDEVENGLHPFAIHELLRLFRERAREFDLAVVCATHSPVVLDQFHEEREAVFVLEPDLPTTPIALTDHPDAEWLQHFSVGDSYAHARLGAPIPPRAAE